MEYYKIKIELYGIKMYNGCIANAIKNKTYWEKE